MDEVLSGKGVLTGPHHTDTDSDKIIREVRPMKFEGRNFVFTGTMACGTRKECEALVRSLGGHVRGTVTSQVEYLIVGEKPGESKRKAAANIIDVSVNSEDEFISWVRSQAASNNRLAKKALEKYKKNRESRGVHSDLTPKAAPIQVPPPPAQVDKFPTLEDLGWD